MKHQIAIKKDKGKFKVGSQKLKNETTVVFYEK
jgi:hypothetical protein